MKKKKEIFQLGNAGICSKCYTHPCKCDRLEEKVTSLIKEMREECLVDFMRASDKDKVIKRITEFIRTQIK